MAMPSRSHDLFDVGRVGERGEVYFLEEFDDRRLCFAQVGRQRCLAIAFEPVVSDLNDHHGGSGSGEPDMVKRWFNSVRRESR